VSDYDPFFDVPPWDGASNVLPIKPVAVKPAELFPVTWIDDAALKLDTRQIIKGLIDPGAFVVIYGPSGSGKSFFTADLAQHIATGAAWRGRKVQQGLVVYIASEAGTSILRRFIAWRDNRLGDTAARVPLAILTRGPNLLASAEVEKLVEQLAALEAQAGMPIVMVVFDTLSRSMHGGDENKAEDMTMAVNAGDVIRDRFSAATVYVHHSGKDPSKGARGHSALFAAADVVMSIENRACTVEKVRDGLEGERFPFSLEPVLIGHDADGDAVYTCLLNCETSSARPSERMPTGRNQKLVLPILRELAQECNDRSPGTSAIPKGVLMLSMNAAIEKITPRFGGEDAGFRVREKIKDAILSLQAANFVGVHGDIVYLL
jgi:KaiC/GvpD/RAD55 family RecA-like ATPase